MNAKDKESWDKAEEIYQQLKRAGVEVVIDDRNERPGVKFKDADLIGYPLRVVVGPKTLSSGQLEVKIRKNGEIKYLPLEGDYVEEIKNVSMDQFLLSPHNWDMILRLLLATVLGGAVGIERGSGDRPAGFRTHILVCTGSALIMLVSMYGFDDTYVSGISNANNRDSARIAAQVVSGIGFLGAGTIMHEGVTVRGLTTAASLWMVSAIGLAAGAGMYVISIVATAIMLITLVSFRSWEKRFQFAPLYPHCCQQRAGHYNKYYFVFVRKRYKSKNYERKK